MIPEFMRFYHYSLGATLNEFAISFFSLVNSMYRLKARESLDGIVQVSAGMAGKEASGTIAQLNKEAKGIGGILDEVNMLRDAKNG